MSSEGATEPVRYYYTYQIGAINRYWSVFLLAGSLVAMAVFRSTATFIIFGVSALGGAYGILRRPGPGFFVELRNNHLIINALTRMRIDYDDIAFADFRTYRAGEILRSLQNLAIGLSRVFGGQFPFEAKAGEVDETSVELKFTKVKWMQFPLPPFLLPRRHWILYVNDAAALRSELRRRLGLPSD